MNAAEPVPRTQPYSKPWRRAAPSVSASASTPSGASIAACVTLTARNSQKPSADR